MLHYIYDGTFEGFLTVIGIIAANNHFDEVEAISVPESFEPNLFTDVVETPTDPVLAAKFFRTLSGKVSRLVLTDIGYCFLSEIKGIEKELFDYIRLLFIYGEKASRHFSNPTVMHIRQTSDKVGHEINRMHGFIRFRKLNNQVYYAPIEPDYNIIQFLAPHFRARFADQQWVIHDLKRQTALYYDLRTCRFLSSVDGEREIYKACQPSPFKPPSTAFDPDEWDYQKLWDAYFHKIAIVERENRKAQRQRMPARYWRHLVEKVES